jgi:hypothetical protein
MLERNQGDGVLKTGDAANRAGGEGRLSGAAKSLCRLTLRGDGDDGGDGAHMRTPELQTPPTIMLLREFSSWDAS